MNHTPIRITVEPTRQDYRRALLWYQGKKPIYIMFALSIIILLLGVIFSENMDDPKIFGIRLELLLASILAPLVFLGIRYFGIWRQSKKLEGVSYPTSITFEPDGLDTKSDLSNSYVKWDQFFKIVETEQEFIIFPQENIFYPVPKRFFENESQVDEFKQLLRDKLGKKAKLLIV